jgi:hypothetical protein
MEALRDNGAPDFTASTLGDTSIHTHGLPSYSLDTSSGSATSDLGVGAFPGMNMVIGTNGAPKFMMRYWRANVKGEAPGGTVARIEFATGRVMLN